MSRNNEYRLSQAIISLSDANTWDKAKLEWHLEEIYIADEAESCLCGHSPIIEICILNNYKNGNRASVGNCCVKKFMEIRSDKLFQAIKRVEKDDEKSLNAETIKYAFENGWVSEWDYGFYLDIWRKRNLTPKQMAQKVRINRLVLERFFKK